MEIAARYGITLPTEPDSAALAAFLGQQKQKDEVHYADLSLAVIKLMDQANTYSPGREVPVRAISVWLPKTTHIRPHRTDALRISLGSA